MDSRLLVLAFDEILRWIDAHHQSLITGGVCVFIGAVLGGLARRRGPTSRQPALETAPPQVASEVHQPGATSASSVVSPDAASTAHDPTAPTTPSAVSLPSDPSDDSPKAAPVTPVSERALARKPSSCIQIKTMLGVVLFPTSHAAGKYGDWLTAIYFTRKGCVKRKSKLNAVHGIDGVYVRPRKRITDHLDIFIVETKINSGRLQPDQLSVAGILSRCEDLIASGDDELRATGELVRHAVGRRTLHRVFRILVIHDLISGISTRHNVEPNGVKLTKAGQWRNHYDVERTLRAKLRSGKVSLLP